MKMITYDSPAKRFADSWERELQASGLRSLIAELQSRLVKLEAAQSETSATGGGNGRVTSARVKSPRQSGRSVSPRARCHAKLMLRTIKAEKGAAFVERRDMEPQNVLTAFRKKANHALSDADVQRIWSASEGEFQKAVESLARARVLTSVIGGRSVGGSQGEVAQNSKVHCERRVISVA